MTKWILVLALCACQSAPRSTMTTTTGFAPELAARRAQMISWLRAYYEAGVFPTDADGKPISVFKDARGVRCPMAELITRSGRGDLVDQIAMVDNKLRLADVHDGELHDWMASSGLTIEEIAMVQGAMDIDYAWMRQEAPNAEVIMARGQVRGRLETAVTALNANTAHSLTVASKRLTAKPVKQRAIRTVATAQKAPILTP
jgi:hypothetical protein